MAFWLGAFSKIQSMFTNSLSPNSLGNNPNLRQQRKILIYCHKTAGFRGYILKIYPSIFVKVNFGENLRRFTKNSYHLYKNYFQFTLDALKNYFSHLIAVGNAKIKRGERKYSLLNSLGKGQIRRRLSKMPSYRSLGKSKTAPPIFKIYRPQAKRKSRYRGV